MKLSQACIQKLEKCTFSDIDECELSGECSQQCVNTIGSYYCACDPGFVLASNKRGCDG